jgi:hypothetical protein
MAASPWNRGSHFSWHNSPAEAMEWFIGKYPERYDRLRQRNQIIGKCDLIFWQDKHQGLKDVHNKLSAPTP